MEKCRHCSQTLPSGFSGAHSLFATVSKSGQATFTCAACRQHWRRIYQGSGEFLWEVMADLVEAKRLAGSG
jgi:hypothetical protein